MTAACNRFFYCIPICILYTCLFICFFASAFSQELQYDKKEIFRCSKYSPHIPVLVAELTKGKTSDKEKFDALFSWVALTIRYDYQKFYSPNGNSAETNFKYVLRKRKGICIDYANLMDTLCKTAGIRNFTVYGYAKDEIFDLNDSLYAHNHAWNAVKLDDEWYVYDVTWAAAGKVTFSLTGFGKRIQRMIESWPQKTKKKTIRNKYIRVCKKYCPPEYYANVPKKFTFTYKKYRFPWLLHLSARFSAPFVRKYTMAMDTSFYLTQPEVFGITHFPDDPVWSLLPHRTIGQFSGDSVYYYLSEKNYKDQERHGVSCDTCDLIYEYDTPQRILRLLESNYRANKNNRFATANGEYDMALYKLTTAWREEDSLAKMQGLDSALMYCSLAKKSLKMARKHVNTFNRLQRRKNTKKRISQVEFNKKNRAFFIKMSATANKKRHTLSLTNRNIRISKNQLAYRREMIHKMDPDDAKSKGTITAAAANELQSKIEKLRVQKDSVNSRIAVLHALIEAELPLVADSIKKKLIEHNLFLSPFEQKVRERARFKDDYKREIIDLNKTIVRYKAAYRQYLDSTLYKLILLIDQQMAELKKKTEEQAQLNKKITDATFTLVKNNAEPISVYENLKVELEQENLENHCWFIANTFFSEVNSIGFKLFRKTIKYPAWLFRNEYNIEKRRFRYVNGELDRRRSQYKGIINHNSRLYNHTIRSIKQYRKDYIKRQLDKKKALKKKLKN